jgi:ABC-2 type transport system permease protein
MLVAVGVFRLAESPVWRQEYAMTQLAPRSPSVPALAPRRYGAINEIGLWTFCLREVRRFWKVGVQTLFAPVVSSLLMLVVFSLAIPENARDSAGGVSFEAFLAPGIVMMSILNNAFQNTSSSIIIAKVQGSHVDFLMPPLSPLELTVGFMFGAVVRGMAVGLVTYAAIFALGAAPLVVAHLWAVIYFSFAASVFMGAVGLLGGIWADKFDHMAAVQNFVIMPLTMLSGTFYPVSRLSEPFLTLSHFNPFFHMIDGFRYGFTGQHESDLAVSCLSSFALSALLCLAAWALLKSGYKLKS